MPWTAKQKQTAVIICKQVGIDNDIRKLILRQLPNAIPSGGGEPSSTAKALNQRDFERFMAIVEDRAGGKLNGFDRGHFASKVASQSTNASERQAQKIRELYDELCARGGKLPGAGIYGFDGLVRKVTNNRTVALEQLTPREASNMIGMLQAMISRRRPAAADPKERQSRMFSDHELTAAGVGGTPQLAGRKVQPEDDPLTRAMAGDEIPF